MTKKWMGTVPKKCDICGRNIGTVFIDGRTSMGPWGCLCPECHKHYGYGLGTGKGQKYRKTKVEGGIEWQKVG